MEEALDGIQDGSTVLLGGFHINGVPHNLLRGLLKKGTKVLEVVAITAGTTECPLGELIQQGRLRRLITSFIGQSQHCINMFLSGEIEVEVVPLGTLTERVRAGGFGIPAFYTPCGVGTLIQQGGVPERLTVDENGWHYLKVNAQKPTAEFNGRTYILEKSLTGDVTLAKAWKADPEGNLVFRKTARNINPVMLMAGTRTIVEVEELVALGELGPDEIHLPGIFVDRIINVPRPSTSIIFPCKEKNIVENQEINSTSSELEIKESKKGRNSGEGNVRTDLNKNEMEAWDINGTREGQKGSPTEKNKETIEELKRKMYDSKRKVVQVMNSEIVMERDTKKENIHSKSVIVNVRAKESDETALANPEEVTKKNVDSVAKMKLTGKVNETAPSKTKNDAKTREKSTDNGQEAKNGQETETSIKTSNETNIIDMLRNSRSSEIFKRGNMEVYKKNVNDNNDVQESSTSMIPSENLNLGVERGRSQRSFIFSLELNKILAEKEDNKLPYLGEPVNNDIVPIPVENYDQDYEAVLYRGKNERIYDNKEGKSFEVADRKIKKELNEIEINEKLKCEINKCQEAFQGRKEGVRTTGNIGVEVCKEVKFKAGGGTEVRRPEAKDELSLEDQKNGVTKRMINTKVNFHSEGETMEKKFLKPINEAERQFFSGAKDIKSMVWGIGKDFDINSEKKVVKNTHKEETSLMKENISKKLISSNTKNVNCSGSTASMAQGLELNHRQRIGRRIAQEFRDGMYVNLGIGIPLLSTSFIPDNFNVMVQGENGVLGLKDLTVGEKVDPDLIDPGFRAASVRTGASFFDTDLVFGMIRGRHLDATVLGAMQVSQYGDLANWHIPGKRMVGMGGSMDLASSGVKVIAAMQHTTAGEHKILPKCTLPLTAAKAVSMIITEKCVFAVCPSHGLTLMELAKGVTIEDVRVSTGCPFRVSDPLKTNAY